MNEFDFLRWPKNYLKACKQFGIDPPQGLESFHSCLTPIGYFAGTISPSVSLAVKILQQFQQQATKIYVDAFTKQVHIEHLNKLQDFILTKGIEDEEEYIKSMDAWYSAVKLMLPPLEIATSSGITIEIAKDCALLCDSMQYWPSHLLQYYADHVNVPESGELDNEVNSVTKFFVENLPIENRLR